MTYGLSRSRHGVTDAMVETFGDLVFQLSHNVQTRRGDPVRLKDFTAYEEQRAEFGLADQEIAERLGLTEPQVIIIRNLIERRRIQTEPYYRLNKLGGGKRFRADQEIDAMQRQHPSPSGLALKAAMSFDPIRVRHFLDEGLWRNDTLTGWLAEQTRARPDGEAIADDNETLTYRELSARVADVAGGLRRLGIGEGDVVAIQLPNIQAYVIAYLAIVSVRAVMTTIYMPYREKELRTLLGHSDARIFICLKDAGGFNAAEAALAMQPDLPSLDHVVTVDGAVAGCTSFSELMAEDGRRSNDSAPVASDPIMLLYTSGTTANPKAVPLNSHQMVSNAWFGAQEKQLGPDDRILSAAPYGHLFGLYALHLALAVGATMVLLPTFTPPGLAQTLKNHKCTVLLAGPAHISACMNMGLLEAGEASSLKLAVLSGAQVPPDLVHQFAGKMPNGAVGQLWGMTETQAGTYTRPDSPMEKAATSAGRPAPGSEIRITDESGQVLAAGEEGELQVRGNNVFCEYYDNPDANKTAFSADGWFRTGDLAVIDDEGYLSLTGRSKDIINRGGVKYNPLDVERLLDGHPDIAQSAIVPVPDPVLGERACVFIVPAGDTPITLEAICGFLLEHDIAKTKLPEQLEIIDEMPLTATRKIIKGRLKPS